MYHHSMISSSWSFSKVVYNSPRVSHISRWDETCVVHNSPCVVHNSPIVACIFQWDEYCCNATNFLDWVLDTNWELPTVETLCAVHKFSAIVLESPYTLFLLGPPDDPTSIHKLYYFRCYLVIAWFSHTHLITVSCIESQVNLSYV